MIFVPPPFAADAIMEAADAGIAAGRLHHRRHSDPRHDAGDDLPARASRRALIGPELPGPHLGRTGQGRHHPRPHLQAKAAIGIVSKSGTLTYEAIHQLTRLGLGQTTCIGIGGDPLIGTSFIDALKLFADDPDTEAVIMIGEIGGTAEEEAAAWIKAHFKKPVVGFIAGQTAPPGRRMGHAGAIIAGGKGTAAEKMAALDRRRRHRRQEPGRHGRRDQDAPAAASPSRAVLPVQPVWATARAGRTPVQRRLGSHEY